MDAKERHRIIKLQKLHASTVARIYAHRIKKIYGRDTTTERIMRRVFFTLKMFATIGLKTATPHLTNTIVQCLRQN